MDRRTALLWLVAINVLLAIGDLFSKRAVATPQRNVAMTTAALGLWITACCMWLPVMRARGFTRLVALADVIGLVMLAIGGYLFLGERLNAKEGIGLGCAIAAVLLLSGE